MENDLYNCPILIANNVCSPTNETSYPYAFENVYLADFYTTSPDHSLDTFLDCDFFFDSFFDCPVLSVESSANTKAYRTAFYPAPPLGRLEQSFASNLPNMPISLRNTNSNTPKNVHLINTTSLTPTLPLCDDGATALLISPPLSPSLKREPLGEPTSASEEPAQKRPKRKRGLFLDDQRLRMSVEVMEASELLAHLDGQGLFCDRSAYEGLRGGGQRRQRGGQSRGG